MSDEIPMAYCSYRGRRRIVEIVGRTAEGWVCETGKHRFHKPASEVYPLNATARKLMQRF